VGVAGALTATLVVSNSGVDDLTGVTLLARFPYYGVYNLDQSSVTGGGTCNSVSNNDICNSSEFVTWDLGDIASGAVDVTVTIPMDVLPAANGIVNGDIIILDAEVTTDAGDLSTAGDTGIVGSNPFQ
jgi:hypothetical protein